MIEEGRKYSENPTARKQPLLEASTTTLCWDERPLTPTQQESLCGSGRDSISGGRPRRRQNNAYNSGLPPTGTSCSSLSDSVSTFQQSPPPSSAARRFISLKTSSNGIGPPAVFFPEPLSHSMLLPTVSFRKKNFRRALGRQKRASFSTPSGRRRINYKIRTLLWMSLLVFVVFSGIAIGMFFVVYRGRVRTGGLATAFDKRIQPVLSNVNVRLGEEGEWVVFYNLFVPFQSFLAGVDRLIVEEQLGQVGQSYANVGSKNGELTVYYTTIGDWIDTDWISDLCTIKYDMKCTHMQHYSQASETVTLGKLHDHCSRNPKDSVIYLHNKGSLHPNIKGQDRWRRTMTAAATSELCLEFGLVDHNCNACGLLFQPLPTSHFPGNMWAARCDYVNQLLSPNEYHARRPVIDEWIRRETNRGLWSKYGGLFPLEAHYTGRGRYESEHWLGSHPDMRPCDVSQEANMDYWVLPESGEDRDYHEFQLAPAPRHNITADWKWHQYAAHPEVLGNFTQRSRDYFLLRGLLYRSLAFYNRVPNTTSSWIWNWFPDGPVWLSALQDDDDDPLHAIQAVGNLPGTAEIRYPPSLLEWLSSQASAMLLLTHHTS